MSKIKLSDRVISTLKVVLVFLVVASLIGGCFHWLSSSSASKRAQKSKKRAELLNTIEKYNKSHPAEYVSTFVHISQVQTAIFKKENIFGHSRMIQESVLLKSENYCGEGGETHLIVFLKTGDSEYYDEENPKGEILWCLHSGDYSLDQLRSDEYFYFNICRFWTSDSINIPSYIGKSEAKMIVEGKIYDKGSINIDENDISDFGLGYFLPPHKITASDYEEKN